MFYQLYYFLTYSILDLGSVLLQEYRKGSVVYDSSTGNYYYGMNRGVQLSGDDLNSSLKSWLPEKSLNDYKLGNCAEVDAINQALNSGANVNGLYMYTINTKANLSKPMRRIVVILSGAELQMYFLNNKIRRTK